MYNYKLGGSGELRKGSVPNHPSTSARALAAATLKFFVHRGVGERGYVARNSSSKDASKSDIRAAFDRMAFFLTPRMQLKMVGTSGYVKGKSTAGSDDVGVMGLLNVAARHPM